VENDDCCSKKLRKKRRNRNLLALDTGNALRTQAKPETAASIELTHMFAGLAGEIKEKIIHQIF